jgi:hypothetical protein
MKLNETLIMIVLDALTSFKVFYVHYNMYN